MPPAYEILLLNTAIPQIQAAQSGDTYVVPRDIAFSAKALIGYADYSGVGTNGLAVAGNVGIGTSSPGARLSVITASANSTAATIGGIEYGGSKRGLTIKTYQSNGGDDCGVEFNAANGLANYGSFKFVANTTTFATIDYDGTFRVKGAGTAGSTDAVQFSGSAPADAMILDSNGSLAVGGTTVVTNNGGITATTTSSGSVAAALAMRNAGTANGSGTLLVFRGVTNASAEHDYAYIGAVAGDTTAKTGYIYFSTTSGSSPAERARITSGGDFLVGTDTAIAGSTSPIQAKSTVAGNQCFTGWNSATSGTRYLAYFGTGSTFTANGSITSDGTNVAYNTSSDYRLKDNAQPLTNSGAFIDALQPKTWNWKADGTKGVGFIAHEVQAVSPSSVVGEKDAVDADGRPVMQAMEYGSAEFIANIIAELQSLRARVAQLEQGN